MGHRNLDFLEFFIPVLNVSDSEVFLTTVTEVDVSPNTFDVSVGNRFKHVRVVSLVIIGDEIITILAEPNC